MFDCQIILFVIIMVASLVSGNTLVLINIITLRYAQL